jgi:tetratricopeptide (TPR) repeat protein
LTVLFIAFIIIFGFTSCQKAKPGSDIDNILVKEYLQDTDKYLNQKNYEKAILSCKKAITYAKNYPLAYRKLCEIYLAVKKPSQAILEITEYLAENPQNSCPYYAIGYIYYKQDNLEKAKNLFNQAITLDKNNTYALNNLGVVYVKQYKYKEAEKIFKKATKTDPNFLWPRYNLAKLYWETKNYNGYTNQIEQIIKCSRRLQSELSPELYARLGIAYQKLSNTEKAYENYKKALKEFVEQKKISIELID